LTIRAISGEIVIETRNDEAEFASQPIPNAKNEATQQTSIEENKPLKLVEKPSLPLPDPRVLWGRALLAIKKANKIMLHTVCVNLGKVELRDDVLVVYVPSRLDYEMLKKPQNCGDLVESLRNLGYNVNIEFVLDETLRDSVDSKIERLQKILGANIQVIN